ncbi:hypothetical protein PpBr36_03174, partial [Pyricularia pennisetigena]|uniref:hypothetical protein n=1 Tax=Pyricularia pennisetigena TaxID=1578925 RepID=UPI00114FC923
EPDKSVISTLHRLNPPVTAAPQTQVSSSQEGKKANPFDDWGRPRRSSTVSPCK